MAHFLCSSPRCGKRRLSKLLSWCCGLPCTWNLLINRHPKGIYILSFRSSSVVASNQREFAANILVFCSKTSRGILAMMWPDQEESSSPSSPSTKGEFPTGEASRPSQPASQASIRWLAASTENWKKCFRCTERLGSKICPTGLPQISQSGFAGGSDSLLLSCLAILYSGKSFFVRTRGSRCARIDARQTDHLEVLKGFWLIFLRFSSGNGCSCVVLEV